ncbi:MAG: hypothetical protein GWO04_04655, partial [Actinobacteria bacterium]|nr:hypothetical protein [Actinomycetota bacterium]
MKDKKALFGIAAGCGCLVVFGAAAIVAILVFAEGASDGPFSGDGTAVVVLSSEEGQGAAAAPVFVARFEALGVEATADDVSDDRIVLTLSNVSDPDGAVAAVLPPQRLAMYLVAADQGPLTGDEASAPPGVSVRRDYDQPPAFAGPTPES